MAKVTREEITQFIEQANKQHQTIKSTAEVFKTETNFWTVLFTKVKDLEMSGCWMYAPILSPLRHFSAPIFQPAIHQE